MALSERENYLRNATMTGPEWMPIIVAISDASWLEYKDEMEDVAARHRVLFPGFEKGKRDYDNYDFASNYSRAGKEFTDAWGCVWENHIDGIHGQVKKSPLDDWSALEDFRAPEPDTCDDMGAFDWDAARKALEKDRAAGGVAAGSTNHGFLFLRLQYLRGFENLMIDIATDEPKLHKLVDIIYGFNKRRIDKWLAMDVDMMSFAEDLGTQNASVMSPKDFRKWIAPTYKKLMRPFRENGKQVFLHSDGYIMELMDDLIDCGVTIINPQDLCNGIDNLAKYVKGRVCIQLDIDRQKIVPFGTRKDIRDLIEEEVRKLGSPAGGLEMIVGIYPPTPPESVDALCAAFEEFRTYWFDGRGK